jgi:hypothetical protein
MKKIFFDFVTFEPVKRELHLIVSETGERADYLHSLGYQSVVDVYGVMPRFNEVSGPAYDALYLLLHQNEQ